MHLDINWSSFNDSLIMIQILFAVYSFIHHYVCICRVSGIKNLATEASLRPRPAPALLLLVSWPGREAPCHALKCRHKTPAPPAIKCAEWQLCRRSGRCGPALYCSTLLRLLASPLQPCPHTPAGGHCSYSLVLSYQCISSLALALNRF